MKTKKKRSSFRFSPVFGPKLGEDQKKEKVFGQSLSVFMLKLSAQVTKGGGGLAAIFQTIPWHHAPLNTPLSGRSEAEALGVDT